MSEIKKTIVYSYTAILTVKIRNFLKKSFWKYTASAALYSVGIRIIRRREILSPATAMIFLNFFLILMCLVFMIIVLSSVLISRKLGSMKMYYTFSPEGIHIFNDLNGHEEEHGWEWILSRELTKKALFLRVDAPKTFEIMLERDKLSEEELVLLTSWMEDKSV
jgi:hypothetical protein